MSAGAYQPDAAFRKAVELLRQSQDPDHQRAATAAIKQHGPTLAFQRALMAVLLHGGSHGVTADVRQSAGLVIKNSLRHYAPAQRVGAKRLSLLLLGERDHTIRRLAGTMIAHVVKTEGLEAWPELAPTLVTNLRQTANVAAAAGSLETLYKVVEDTGDLIMTAGGGHSRGLGDQFTTSLLAYLRHPTPKCRVLALKCFMVLVYQQPVSFDVHLEEIVVALAKLKDDPDVEVQTRLVQTLSCVVDMYVKYPLFQQPGSTLFASICQHMLRSAFHPNDEVLQAAIVFWAEAATIDTPSVQHVVLRHLPRLLPHLVAKLALEDDDPDLAATDDDWTVPDRPQDAVPRAYAKMTGYYSGDGMQGEDEDDGDDGDGGDGYDAVDGTTTRKKAGRAIGNMAEMFPAQTLRLTLPLIKAGLEAQGPDAWRKKEAAMAALGAVQAHCLDQLAGSMSGLVRLAVQSLGDAHAPVACISCWLLGQFGPWFATQALEGRPEMLRGVADRVAKLFLHPKKSIQFSAMSCLAYLIEESRQFFGPMVAGTLKIINEGQKNFQAKSVVASLDVIRTMAEQDELEAVMQDENISKMIVTLTVGKWIKVPHPTDRLHVAIMDTLYFVLPRLHTAVVRAAIQNICKRTVQLQLVHATELVKRAQTERDAVVLKHAMDDSFEFFVCGAYLLDCAVELLEEKFTLLALDARLVPALLKVTQFKNAHVNNAVFSFFGDLAVHCYESLVAPHAAALCLALRQNVAPRFQEMSSNAVWTLSEVAKRAPAAVVQPHAAAALEKVRLVLHFWRQQARDATTANLLLNCTILLNFLAERAPQAAAAAFVRGQDGLDFLWQWMLQLTHTSPRRNFEIKLRGTVTAVQLLARAPQPFLATADPASAMPRFRNAMALLDLAHSWMQFLQANPAQLVPALQEALRRMVDTVRQRYTVAGLWPEFYRDVHEHRPEIATVLKLAP